MGVEEWKNIFTNAGSLIMGLILALGQLYTIWNMKKQEKEKAKKNDKNYGEKIKNENKYTMQIQKEIEELRQILGADRVQVLEFHNGTDFSTRKGYKMDCTYEALKYGNEPTRNILQNYPTTMLPIFINNIIEDKEYFVGNIEEIIQSDMSTYAMKKNIHVGAFFDVVLELNNAPIGILAVQYIESHELNSEQIAMIHAKKIIIEELLK